MERGFFEYSLIRAVPNVRRGEWLNVGVCVFLPDGLDMRIPEAARARLARFDPAVDIDALLGGCAEWPRITAGLKSARVRQMMLSGLSGCHASELGQFAVPPDSYEAEVQSILCDLVVPQVPDIKGAMEVLMRAHLGDGLAGQSAPHWQVEDGGRYQLFQGGWELAAIADAAGIRLILRRPKPVWISKALQDSPLYASNG